MSSGQAYDEICQLGDARLVARVHDVVVLNDRPLAGNIGAPVVETARDVSGIGDVAARRETYLTCSPLRWSFCR